MKQTDLCSLGPGNGGSGSDKIKNDDPLVNSIAKSLENNGLTEGKDFEKSNMIVMHEVEDNTNSSRNAAQGLTVLTYYHSDYLGNVEYITDEYGLPIQYFYYTAFGETAYEDKLGNYESRYRFNGKEQDDVTGLYYYGARYYNPSTSVWLSVDAMANQRPDLTPYNFVSNNPIVLIDPTGLTWENPEEDKKTENFLVNQFQRIRNSFQRKANRLYSRVDKLREKGKEHRADRKIIDANYYQRGADEMQTAITELRDMGSKNNPQVFSLNQALNATNGTKRESNGTIRIDYNQICDLVHELTHAYDISKGNIIAESGASGGDLTYYDELKAYRRVWFFSPNALNTIDHTQVQLRI